MSRLLMLLILISLFFSISLSQKKPKHKPTLIRDTLLTSPSGDTLDGIKYFINIHHPDTTKDERMPTYNPKEKIDDFISVDEPPKPIKKVKPYLPDFSDKRLTVDLWVKCLIDVDGKVKKAEILKSSAVIFNESVLSAAKKWEFTPAMILGKPIAVWASIPFHIRIDRGKHNVRF